MADVELVIKIDEGIAKGIIDGENDTPRHIVRGFQSTIADAIKNGTPLPQGHGKIVDIKQVENVLDKIRAEIVELGQRTMNDNRASGIWACRDIIDKYRTESEE